MPGFCPACDRRKPVARRGSAAPPAGHKKPKRLIAGFMLVVAISFAQTSDEKDIIATAQKLFDGMAAHDAAAIRSATLPEARLYAVRDDRPPTSSAAEAFAAQIASAPGALLERFTEAPRVMIRGRMAQVWGEYEFLRDGKFNHCGVDTFTLFKTAEGWKIAAISYTSETTGCKGH
jgi:hypothetical protein